MKKLLLKSMLLLCALVVGSMNGWAANANFSYTDFSGQGASGSGGDLTGATHGNITITGKGNGNTNYLQVYGSNYLIITPSSGATITSIVLTATSGYIKTWTASDESSVTISENTATWSGSSTSAITLTNNASAQARITGITVTYTPAGGGSSVDEPSFSPAGSAVNAGSTITITQASADQIRYTLDGTNPTKTTGTVYSAPISITTATTIKAIAIKGDNVSDVATASYTINVTNPTFSPYTGSYPIGTMITITSAGNTVRYTTNGDNPTESSTEYTAPIELTESMTIKAIAVDGYGNKSSIRSATYTATLPGQVDITPNYSFFNETAAFSGNSKDEVSGTTTEGITVTYTRNGTSLYANTTSMRVYPKNTIKIDAPEGKVITKIIYTQSNATDDDMESSVVTYTTSTHTWSGNASSVTFTRPSTGSSYLQFTKISVVLAAKVTIGTYQWATYVSNQVMDFTGSEVKAYVITGASGSAITKTPVTKAAANTPLLLNAPAETYTIPAAASGTDYSTSNKLVAGDGTAVAYDANSGYNYVLGVEGSNAMFLQIVNGTPATVPVGKAYLSLDAAPARALSLFDDEETTGVNELKIQKADNQYFNLAGQRVAQPTKGLYIVNGKKVIIK